MIEPVKEFNFLVEAQDLYREFWDRAWLGHEDKSICNFDGSSQDLDMLAYCEYELGFPEESYSNAAIIWGNVICRNSIAEWGRDSSGALHIFAHEEHVYRYAIHLQSYVHNFMDSGLSQFQSFEFLTEKVLIEMMLTDIPLDQVRDLHSIVKSNAEPNDDSYSRRYIYALTEIYGPDSKMCTELSSLLKESE